jgi:putative ABC transport system ATP-binding protein
LPTDLPLVRCENVHKTYATGRARVEALKGIDAEFPAGVIAVVGPSGSGKSSLLRLVAGIGRATAGKVFVAGHDLSVLSERSLRALRRGIVGYVFQRPADNLIPHLTVDEHLELAAHLGGARPPRELLSELGLAHRHSHRPHQLSGGEQQRAALAFALAARPRLIVADEPTAELDDRSASDLIGVVRRLAETGVSFLIATHDRTVTAIADTTLELDHGLVRDQLTGLATPLPGPSRTAAGDGGEARGRTTGLHLRVTEVSKSYARASERVHALRDVSLRLSPGELVGVMGRSGSGKTTLLNVLVGWERPDEGEVWWDDHFRRVDPARVAWKDVSILPQKFGLLDELTVRENIEYPARLAGKLDATRDECRLLVDEFGLAEIENRFPTETSVGQQQRIALARALVRSPGALLADEPTGHQDAASAERVLAALRRAADNGTCCVVATHNTDLGRYFDRVLFMQNGRMTAM